MAARNIKNQGAGHFDTADKLQSNTLKRHPKMDLNKTDLLQLLSYLEGEVQARDVAIAALKAEKAKQLLYQAKYGRFGLGDPFMALQRDSDNMKDNSFDETAIKAMYDNQLAQLENLIATQRKAQLKMREQLAAAEKRYHKALSELEDEKRKHAQDTAQGDDVTYMLEKERERLRQEIEYEKSQSKKLEKDLKKTLSSLEEERANSIKHKQVAVMLIKEQKKIIEKLVQEKQKSKHFENQLKDEKSKTENVVEGLVMESKKSLKMEAAMEKQLSDFDIEREQLRNKLAKEEAKNKELQLQIDSLQMQSDTLQRQLTMDKSLTGDPYHSVEVKPLVSGGGAMMGRSMSREYSSGVASHVSDSSISVKPVPKTTKPIITEGSIRVNESPDRYQTTHRSTVRPENVVQKTVRYGSPSQAPSPDRMGGSADNFARIGSPELRIAPVGAVSADKAGSEGYRPSARIGMSPGSTAVVSSGGKVLTVSVGHSGGSSTGSGVNLSPRKVLPAAGRGTPPPLPPNKPVFTPSPVSKPSPPPKVGVTVAKERGGAGISGNSSPKPVHIPVSVVHSTSSGTVIGRSSAAGSDSSTSSSSPIRKPTQSSTIDNQTLDVNDVTAPPTSSSSSTLDFLGPEMADLQQLLSSIMSDSSSVHVTLPPSSSSSSDHQSLASLASIHKLASSGDVDALTKLILDREADVNLPMKDGTTPLICAAEHGHKECLKVLLDNGAYVSALRDNRYSSLHAAAAGGHAECVRLLLAAGGNPNQGDQHNWTSLHLSATYGHIECCKVMIDNGARINVFSNILWTPLHCAVHTGQVKCLEFLLTYQPPVKDGSISSPYNIKSLVDVADKDGWTITHLAVMKDTTDCLEVILNNCQVDINKEDRWGRTVFDVATPTCYQVLHQSVNNKEIQILVTLDLHHPNQCKLDKGQSSSSQSFIIGSVPIAPNLGWSELEVKLQQTFSTYLSNLDTGLKTKKTSRLDPETPSDSLLYTLGLGPSCICEYALGSHKWKAGTTIENLPHQLVCNNHIKSVSVIVEESLESVALDVLFPVSVLQNYVRLLEHYKSVVFYGPDSSGKSYLAERLANFVAKKETANGKTATIHKVDLTKEFSNQDLIKLLKETGCMVKEGTEDSDTKAPILILDDLEKVDVAAIFGKLLNAVEHRGQYHTFMVQDKEGNSGSGNYFFVESLYIIATMNKSRSTGLDLTIQQRFRWVHFRIDIEPIRNLLARHLLRKFINMYRGQLPTSDSLVFRAVEWIICVWQRLNDGVGKLGLPDVVFGPYQFISCPVETKDAAAIYSWLVNIWNDMIAPAVRDAVVKGTGKDTSSDGQQKVSNTALYVLMQKAVVPGCPLSGQDKERYLSRFSGSNELEIPMKVEKVKSPTNGGSHQLSRTSGGRSSTSKNKHRNSFGFDSKQNSPLNSNSKRRSLSENSLKNSIEYEEEVKQPDPNTISAKVPKLEIRSPNLFQFSLPLKPFSGYSSDSGQVPENMFSSLPSQRGSTGVSMSNNTSPLKTHGRKSRSSENLSGIEQSYNFRKSAFSTSSLKDGQSNLFSFSLTTPTSLLSSFKLVESHKGINPPKSSYRKSTGSMGDSDREIPVDKIVTHEKPITIGATYETEC